MSKKLCFLISVIIVVALAAPAAADELLASYEDSEMADLTISSPGEPTLTVTRVLGGVGDVPPATDGDYALRWVWTNETDRKITMRHDWATSMFDLSLYNKISVDVWYDEPNAQPATIGIYAFDEPWPTNSFWAPALSVPTGIQQWHTVEIDIRVQDANDINDLDAFVFENLAGDAGVIYMDNMWLLTAPLVKAWRPIPFDKAVSVGPNEDLSWTAGIDANSQNVYLGTTFAEVNDANTSTAVIFKGNQALADVNYDPGTLQLSKTYYWRVDGVNESDPNFWKGDVWSFKTDPELGYVEIPLCSFETSDPSYDINRPPANSGDMDFTMNWGDQLPGDANWDPLGPLPEVNVPTASDGCNVLGLAWAGEEDLEVDIGIAWSEFTYNLSGIDEMAFDVYYPANDAEGGFNPLPHSIVVYDYHFVPAPTPSSNLPTTRGQWHTIVVDVSHLDVADMDHILDFMLQAHGEGFDPDDDDPNNWGALMFMDNLRLRYAASKFATFPRPGNGAAGVDRNEDIKWRAGVDASSHDVYFGTSFADVNDATTSTAVIFRGNQPLADVNYEPNLLDPSRTYYWRIDEVNDPNVWKGEVWSFTTVEYSIVDDFDSYVDTTALRAVWGTSHLTNNGAERFVETTPELVRDGNSMRYYFRNLKAQGQFRGSEVEADTSALGAGADWTVGGAEALVLYFYGDATNLTDTSGVVGGIHQDQMYVALEDGSANVGVVKYPDMNAIKETSWHEWNIDLEDPYLSAVDMNNVSKVYIGFGGQKIGQTVAGAGKDTLDGDTVWFDDIEVWPPRCVAAISLPEGDFTGDCLVDNDDLEILAHGWLARDYNVTAVTPGSGNLVAWYEFEDNFNDSSGGGNTGSPHGGISFVSGPNGLAISLDGLGDYVSIPDSNTPGGVFDINDVITLSAWIKVTTFDKWYQTIIAKGDDSWRLARYQETDQLEFACSGLSGGAVPPFGNVIGRTDVDDGQWHHVAGVYDGSRVHLYIDGLLDNRENASGPIDNSIDYEVYIGENAEDPNREWNGGIDDVRIYHQALSHAEILNLAGASEVYQPVWSSANISDEEAKLSKSVDFKDYAIMANRWLEQLLFPFE